MTEPKDSIWKHPAIKAHMAAIGAKGGATKGKSKSRGSAGARKTAQARWAKVKRPPA